MTKIAYFECFAGASGDMLLGVLLGSGIDRSWFVGELDKLTSIKDDFRVEISDVVKKGITAVDVEVTEIHHHHEHNHDHHHRGLKEIGEIIESSGIDKKTKDLALKIFNNLARAEAKVHGTDINKIHFHEVGAIDSIVDIVGFAILFSSLNIDKVIVSPVNTGYGTVECAHGVMPVPAPATLEIISTFNWPVDNSINVKSELLTPTGAAILATIKDEFGGFPCFNKINSVSYGAGKRELSEIANVIRLTIGEGCDNKQQKDIFVLETNIDDIQPEFYDYIFERLFKAGSLDVFLTPVYMKKNRPANILTVLCREENRSEIEKIIFEETSTLGIRSYKTNRTVLGREIKKVNIEGIGEIRIKIGKDSAGKILSQKPEYEDCAELARKHNIPLKEVYKKALLYLESQE